MTNNNTHYFHILSPLPGHHSACQEIIEERVVQLTFHVLHHSNGPTLLTGEHQRSTGRSSTFCMVADGHRDWSHHCRVCASFAVSVTGSSSVSFTFRYASTILHYFISWRGLDIFWSFLVPPPFIVLYLEHAFVNALVCDEWNYSLCAISRSHSRQSAQAIGTWPRMSPGRPPLHVPTHPFPSAVGPRFSPCISFLCRCIFPIGTMRDTVQTLRYTSLYAL